MVDNIKFKEAFAPVSSTNTIRKENRKHKDMRQGFHKPKEQEKEDELMVDGIEEQSLEVEKKEDGTQKSDGNTSNHGTLIDIMA